jgi:hypothetical protein
LFCLLQQQARPLPLLVGSEETAETPMKEVALFTTYPSTFLAVERRTTLPTNVDTLTFFRLPTAFASKAGRKRHLPDGENASALDAADGFFGGFLACPGLRLRHPHDTAALRYPAVTVREFRPIGFSESFLPMPRKGGKKQQLVLSIGRSSPLSS